MEAYNIGSTTFRRYINSGKLYQLLLTKGYQKKQKILTPAQIKVIIGVLGEIE
jgi:hypothetical protein